MFSMLFILLWSVFLRAQFFICFQLVCGTRHGGRIADARHEATPLQWPSGWREAHWSLGYHSRLLSWCGQAAAHARCLLHAEAMSYHSPSRTVPVLPPKHEAPTLALALCGLGLTESASSARTLALAVRLAGHWLGVWRCTRTPLDCRHPAYTLLPHSLFCGVPHATIPDKPNGGSIYRMM